MLERIVGAALNQRLIVLLFALATVGWGMDSYWKLPIDAFPDVAPIQVLVAMRAPGLTPEEIESRIVAPIEIAARGVPSLVRARSTTRYAVALITFEFAEGVDIFWARAQINERLAAATDQFPAGTSGGLAPIVTPLAEMLMFTVVGGDLTPTQQRSLVDWTIRPALRGVPGVADVNVMGGYVRTFEVAPSPSAMAARGITTAMLTKALADNNGNDGAGRVSDGEEALLVRVEGRLQTLEQIKSIVIVSRPTGVVRVSDVAEARAGALARNGVVTRSGNGEAVWATVLGLRGADARSVVDGVKARLAGLQSQLPDNVHLEIFYDRSDLIASAVWTVQKVLLEAIALVVILLVLFLGNLRAASVVSITLPLAVLATFGVMRLWGLSANIMSLGGLAIAIGLLVDCTVVVVENVEHRLVKETSMSLADRIRLTFEATRDVAAPLVSGVAIIIVVFLPLLTLQGLEGRLFAPVALTICFALAVALFLALTFVPVMSTAVMKPGQQDEPLFVRKLGAIYAHALAYVMVKPLALAAIVAVGVGLAGVAALRVGNTFMPTMDEGSIVLTVRKHPTASIDTTKDIDLRIQRAVMAVSPDIQTIMARAGADELGIDPVGLNETDMFISLVARKDRLTRDSDELVAKLRKALEDIPGISFSFSQPIDMRVQEMIIGARGDIVVKIIGHDLGELNRLTAEIAATLRKIDGAQDVFGLRNDGMRYLTTRIDQLAAGRLGLSVVDIQDALRVWIDGKQIGLVLEGPVRTPLVVRGDKAGRSSPADFSRLPLVAQDGKAVELSQVATIKTEDGPIQIIREDAERYATALSNVSGRDLVGFVDEAKAAVARDVKLPNGFRLDWGGQFENQQRASARLMIVVPIALSLIFLLLYMTFGSLRQAVLVFCNVPFAAIGGILALYLSGEFMSVPASVGFIALVGIAVLNGVVMISYINKLREQGFGVRDAALEGARRRMRPVILTASIAAFGLAPFLFATGPGAEIQRPLAIVVIGGLLSATLLTLALLPVLYDRFGVASRDARPKDIRDGAKTAALEAAQ